MSSVTDFLRRHGEVLRRVSFTQGVFWAATGAWPILHLKSFEAITGPKRDRWLVRTIGGLITVVGATLISGGLHKPVPREVALLGVGSALALGAADVYYTAKGTLRPTYLADAVVEAGFVAAWALQKPWRSETVAETPAVGPALKLC